MTDQLKRGEVWLANLNPTQGSEQAGVRPVIIFQNDIVSQFSTTTIAIPLTTNQRRASTNLYADQTGRRWIITRFGCIVFSTSSAG
jgi:mRNA-degrading endonuclease toxin of MazEF toxin-antitoxin module